MAGEAVSSIAKAKAKKSSKGGSSKASTLEILSTSKLDQLKSSGHAKPSKVKKRRGKKQLHSQEDPMVVEDRDAEETRAAAGKELRTAVQDHVTEGQIHVTGNGRGLSDGGPLEVTAVQLSLGEGGESFVKERRMSRAEERKEEIEKKRAEKKEMERLRKLAEEEEKRLKVRWAEVNGELIGYVRENAEKEMAGERGG